LACHLRRGRGGGQRRASCQELLRLSDFLGQEAGANVSFSMQASQTARTTSRTCTAAMEVGPPCYNSTLSRASAVHWQAESGKRGCLEALICTVAIRSSLCNSQIAVTAEQDSASSLFPLLQLSNIKASCRSRRVVQVPPRGAGDRMDAHALGGQPRRDALGGMPLAGCPWRDALGGQPRRDGGRVQFKGVAGIRYGTSPCQVALTDGQSSARIAGENSFVVVLGGGVARTIS